MSLESPLEIKCLEHALGCGVRSIKLGKNGEPDRMFLIPYKERIRVQVVWFAEFKRPDGKGRVSKLQETKKLWLENAGFRVDVVDGFEQFCYLLEQQL